MQIILHKHEIITLEHPWHHRNWASDAGSVDSTGDVSWICLTIYPKICDYAD